MYILEEETYIQLDEKLDHYDKDTKKDRSLGMKIDTSYTLKAYHQTSWRQDSDLEAGRDRSDRHRLYGSI